jgi:hypothetical protein
MKSKTMPNNPNPHLDKRQVFILRLWARGKDAPVWIAEIQEISTGKITHVQGLEALFDWLKEKTAQTLDASQENNPEIPGEQKFTLRI